jgi:hypothetical protein
LKKFVVKSAINLKALPYNILGHVGGQKGHCVCDIGNILIPLQWCHPGYFVKHPVVIFPGKAAKKLVFNIPGAMAFSLMLDDPH